MAGDSSVFGIFLRSKSRLIHLRYQPKLNVAERKTPKEYHSREPVPQVPTTPPIPRSYIATPPIPIPQGALTPKKVKHSPKHRQLSHEEKVELLPTLHWNNPPNIMPSEEGKIRQLLGPARGNLKGYAESGKTLLEEEKDTEEGELQNYLKEVILKEKKLRSALEKYKEIREVRLADECIKDDARWKNFCDEDEEHHSLVDMAETVLYKLVITIDMIQKKLDSMLQIGITRAGQQEQDAMKREVKETNQKLDDALKEMQNMKVKFAEDLSKKDAEESLSVKVPKLQLRSFDGCILDYQSWSQCFKAAIDSQKKMHPVTKFGHLISKLEGQAADVISGLALTEENYPIAMDLLERRYGSKQKQIAAHNLAISNLQRSTMDTASIRTTFDKLEKHVRYLETAGEIMDTQGNIENWWRKFPAQVRHELSMRSSDTDVKWTLKTFRDSMEKYISSKESAENPAGATSSPTTHYTTESLFTGFNPNPRYSSQYQHGRQSGGANWRNYRGKLTCWFCSGFHRGITCTAYPTAAARREKILKDNKRCVRCLREDHVNSRKCKANIGQCKFCRQTHMHSLCPSQFGTSGPSSHTPAHTSTSDNRKSAKKQATSQHHTCTAHTGGKQTLLQTASVKVFNEDKSQCAKVSLVLDSGSEKTYITESLAKKLNLPRLGKEYIDIFHFGSRKPIPTSTDRTELQIKLANGQMLFISANIVPDISGSMRKAAIPKSVQRRLKGYNLADIPSESGSSIDIDILIGMDLYWQLIEPNIKELDTGLYLVKSRLGWLITGRIATGNDDSNHNMTMISHDMDIIPTPPESDYSPSPGTNNEPSLTKFWRMETLGIQQEEMLNDDQLAVEHFNRTVKYLPEEKRYQVSWPWNGDANTLPDNYQLAFCRLQSVYKNISKQNGLLKEYHDIIQNQVRMNIIEELPENEVHSKNIIHYLPHHCVIDRARESTKVRIVMDASSHMGKMNPSLNSLLYRGPCLIEPLVAVLLRFRLNPIAICSDIEKAYHMLALSPSDKDCCRFLWLKSPEEPPTPDNIQIYRYCRVLFGIVSSSFLLGSVIKYHLENSQSPYAKKLLQDCYVDNYIGGASSLQESQELYTAGKELFSEASMNMRQFATNSTQFLEWLPEADRTAVKDIFKVLGMNWDRNHDELSISYKRSDHPNTKRGILKSIAEIYDPCSLASPTQLKARILIQELWKAGAQWDQPIGDEMEKRWNRIKDEMDGMDKIKVPRYIGGEHYKLLCFTDSSKDCYSACVYLHCQVGNTYQCNLMFVKSRVSPVGKRTLTIPRLELLSVLVGVRCMNFMSKHLKLTFEKQMLFTDSKCVLHWVKSTRKQSRFLENRLSEIRSSKNIYFSWIQSALNPSDLATRGATSAELQVNSQWWFGPHFLMQDASKWPTCEIPEIDPITLEKLNSEVKTPKIVLGTSTFLTTENGTMNPPSGIDLSRFSSLTRLHRVTAWVNRVIHNMKQKDSNMRKSGELCCAEISQVKLEWQMYVQMSHFSEDRQAILEGEHTDLTKKFGLKMDEKGLMRCYGGRLAFSELSECAKTPVLLPSKCHYTELVINDIHQKLFHSGVQHTLSKVRNEFWVIKGYSTVKRVLNKCMVCRRYNNGPYPYPKVMPELPKERVSRALPFKATGADEIGPLFIRENDQSTSKVWLLLLCCLSTRSVHFEVLRNQSAEQFIMALRRFIAIRSAPSMIVLDRAPSHVVAQNLINDAFMKMVNDPSVKSYIANENIEFKFSPSYASWWFGLYERLVQNFKRACVRGIGRQILTYDELITVVAEIQSCINSRPLCYAGSDLTSGYAICPSDFLCLSSNTGLPDVGEDDKNDPTFAPDPSPHDTLLKNWRRGNAIVSQFWEMFRSTYLHDLRNRKNMHKLPRVQAKLFPGIGHVCLVEEKHIPRGRWKLAKITELHKSTDGEIRHVTLVTPDKQTISRPISKIYPLECSAEIEQGNVTENANSPTDKQTDGKTDATNLSTRPTRKAKQAAAKKIKQILIKENMSDESD